MIKLTQVMTTTVGVTRNELEGPVVEKQHSFKDVWINPKYVMRVEEDATLNGENERSPLVEGLDRRATFSRVRMYNNNNSTYFSVVGHPNTIVAKVKE